MTEKSASNHDVDPQDILRTFTNSFKSGGTLGGLANSLNYYKDHIASNDWSNMSPSNAYQNYMFRKNLVSEVQKLARELNKMPTEEARILADLSKSRFSQEGVSNNDDRAQRVGAVHDSTTVVMDLNRASIVA